MQRRATLVCCYNKPEIYEQMAEDVGRQSEQIEMIAIDNRENKFSSNAEAYNSVLGEISTEYVIFLHQDILFNDETTIERFIDDCKNVGAFDIVGVVGKKRGCPYGLGNIIGGLNKKRAVKGEIFGMQNCDTVDECFFGGRTECFKKFPFSEKLCNGWHLYAIERCIAALVRGDKVYVSNSNLIHISGGKTDHSYNLMLYRISKHYSGEIDYIATTCEDISTKPVVRELKYLKLEFHVLKRDLLEKIGRKS